MKKYFKPIFTVNYFSFDDVITSSPNDAGHNFIDDNFV